MNFSRVFALLLLLAVPRALASVGEHGFLDVTVFEGGGPKQGFAIVIDNETKIKTSDLGASLTSLPVGDHILQIEFNDQSYRQAFKIVKDQPTVILINLEDGFQPDFSVEQPAEPKEEQDSLRISLDGPKTEFQGRILSSVDRQPIKGVRVYIRGLQESSVTDDEGRFKLDLPQGELSFSMVHPRFNTLSMDRVAVNGQSDVQTFAMSPTGIKLEEFVVTAPHIKGSMSSLMDDRRESSEVVDVIGAEQMKKAGDSDAASAIRRVTGLTLVDSKYPYIRGTGGRYVSTFLNGFNLPSPDPSKRVVPLDMFPTGILESINVVKTSSSEYSGEFGGGHIQLKTTSLPEEFFVKYSMSVSAAPGSNDGLSYDGGDRDWLGYDDGTRRLPGLLRVATKNDQKLTERSLANVDGFSPEEMQLIGRSLPNNYNVQEIELPVSRGMSLSMGDGYNLGGKWRFGWLASGIYGDEWETNVQRKAEYQAPEYKKDPYYESNQTERLVKIGATGSLGFDLGEHHQLRMFTSLLRRTSDETYFSEGNNENWDGEFRSYFLKWQEREMILRQYWGSHTMPFLGDLKLDWRYGVADAELYQPDTREYRYQINNDRWEFNTRKGGNKRNFSEMKDDNDEMGVDLTFPQKFGGFGLTLKTGYHKIERKRNGKTRRYGYDLAGTVSPQLLQQDLETIFAEDNIGRDGFVIKELTLGTDSYRGQQEVKATYGQLEFDFFDTVIISGGLRQEESSQFVKTFDLHAPNNQPALAALVNDHSLPSFNTTWKFSTDMQLRFAYSKSLARPDFRELSPAPYIDDETGDSIQGNEELETTVIDAYDTRWEWYGLANESVSFAVFYKNLEKPIEVSIVNGSEYLKYNNAEAATTYGAEVEWHKNLGFMGSWANNFKTGGNIAYMYSRVRLSEDQQGIQTNDDRPLQGQSPYAVNLYLFYDNLKTDTELGLLFNQMGPRIATVGQKPFDDVYEQPLPQLDFTVGQAFAENYKLSFKVKNILDADSKYKQEGRETAFKEKSREYSLGLSAKF
ncbi:TonB-dependent receptor domain-containing protein [Pseudobacteriovorax antillogorgiicola]|uniref:TonB-dependent receptor n=1 Tax=Pseudobacteriovorax antillogorgiicola TaxID=1513793 RepID=A0A1Y6CCB5_9BACT|nr:TonB-dependent receptor [Pseudobacteriovorax antillogorgiicola]TCS48719.1 TonB-dependent receptor [Pseudobacteriovorax antillogorgiicola]SMF54565.1 TonB-dependent receptor [Pseudobacteriovorax antillogorgiicola]